MHLRHATVGLAVAAAFCVSTLAVLADEAKAIFSAEANEDGIVAKLRPMLPDMTTGDPIRFAVHFAGKDGPLDHSKAEFQRVLDRTTSLKSFEIAVKLPGGEWKILRPDADEKLSPRQAQFAFNPTFLLEANSKGVRSLTMNGTDECALSWKWDHVLTPGVLKVAVRGTLNFKDGKDMPFKVGPIEMKIVKASNMAPTTSELEAAAKKAVAARPEIAAEKLVVKATDLLTVADEKGRRIVRVRVDLPPPPPGAPMFPGGHGYWRYEVVMNRVGQADSIRRQRAGFCIAAGAPVATPSGVRPIESIQPGDLVWAYDVAHGKRVASQVRAVMTSTAPRTLRIGELRVTPNHRVFTEGEWKPAGELKPTDQILTADGKQRQVGAIELIEEPVEVFDLAVAEPHNFYAGDVLVHNKSIAWSAEYFVAWYALWRQVPPPKKP